MVLKSPIYNSVHSLFQLVHRNQHVKESMKVISLLRKRETLATELQIDTQALGCSLLSRQGIENPSVQACEDAFRAQVRKIEQIRNISSPILKVITLSRVIDEMMGLMGEIGEI